MKSTILTTATTTKATAARMKSTILTTATTAATTMPKLCSNFFFHGLSL